MLNRRWVASAAGILILVSCGSPFGPDGSSGGDVRDFTSFLRSNDFLIDAAFSSDGTLWALTFLGDLLQELNGTITRHNLPFEATERGLDVFVDSADRVWLASTAAFGEVRGGEWDRQTTAGGTDIVPPVRAIAVNSDGDLLLGAGNSSEGGLWLRRGDQWTSFTPDNSALKATGTSEIVVGPDGAFWIASMGVGGRGGVGRVRDGRFESILSGQASGLLYPTPERLAVTETRLVIGFEVMFLDDAGPDGGLQTFDLATGVIDSIFPATTGVVSSRVRAIAVDAHGAIWFTTSLDEAQPTCPNCFSGVARLEPSGQMTAVSRDLYGLAPNEFLPMILRDPIGQIHVVTGERVIHVSLPEN